MNYPRTVAHVPAPANASTNPKKIKASMVERVHGVRINDPPESSEAILPHNLKNSEQWPKMLQSGRGTGRHEAIAVKLIGPDRRNDHRGAFRHGFERSWIGRVGGDQRQIRRSADKVAYLSEFGSTSPGHRPPDFVHRAMGAEQMFGHQSAGNVLHCGR